jgi:hypothetical protein
MRLRIPGIVWVRLFLVGFAALCFAIERALT